MHGLELVLEAVRQVRGTSTAQVPGCRRVDGDRRPDGQPGQQPAPGLGGHTVSDTLDVHELRAARRPAGTAARNTTR